jgi:transglutaminase-like putative cysteine protease/Tfp pilus assembly protein PilF
VEAALAIAPGFREAERRKARIFRQKGWVEEACRAFERMDAAEPDRADVVAELAACAKSRSRYEEAREHYERLVEAWPTDRGALEELAKLEERRESFGDAADLYERLIAIYPYRTDPFLALGTLHRSQQQWDEAALAYLAAAERDPEYAWPHELLGDLYMEQGKPKEAAAAWRRSLELNPDDHVLWERVELLEPEGADLLSPYVPDDEALDEILAKSASVEVFPGASYVMLLDHEAMQLHPDGSLRRVVSMVVRIEDESGRDRFSTHSMPQDGHLRVRRAYVVDPEGRRQEVSSLRNRTIRFQDLRPGSTIVLQYRHDAFQQTFLNNHWHGTWFFQQDTGQGERAEWTVVVPKDRALRVHLQGPVKEERSTAGDHLVYRYTASHVPPLRIEQQTLPLTDLAALVSASTLPDWDFFARWEWSMVEDSLRLTPDLEQKAREVVAAEAPPQEKVDAVYRFVANGVRYVQDYEERIAGVRPHPASLTYERRYGDCKDKVVLMMMLLRALDVDARFAMLSTFSSGQLMKDAPSQQFNHAIVYVPAQEGIAQARFYDPTAEHLDRGNLRWDDQGRTALVLREDGWDFIEIPYDPPEFELQSVSADLQLAGPDEPSRVRVVLMARGRTAAGMRKALTNDETARRMIEGFTCGYLFPGARLLDYGVEGAKDIDTPVRITAEIAAPNIVRAEDRTLRMDVLDYARVASKYGKWKERRHPIWFGPPDKVEVTLNATPPAGYKIERLPTDQKIEGPCLTLDLRSEKTGEGGAKVHYTMVRDCAELPAEQYDALRDTTLRISRALSEPVVLER